MIRNTSNETLRFMPSVVSFRLDNNRIEQAAIRSSIQNWNLNPRPF
jgi:hypothetical protein